MKQTLSWLLAMILALGCLSPALALEPPAPRFDDVEPDAWYAPYVDICVADGLMEGVGDGKFAPEETLSGDECSVLALRLYDLLHGGDGEFDPAPEDWGYAALAFPDGQVRQGYIEDDTVWDLSRFHRVDDGHLRISLNTKEELTWGASMDGRKATFSMNGVDCPGELYRSWGGLYFEPDPTVLDSFKAMRNNSYPMPEHWYRDAWYWADQKGLRELLQYDETREGFACAIAQAAGELEPINDIFALPDTAEPAVLALCRTGVLTGADEYGTFDPYRALTRAEATAILSRVLHPELRVEYTIQPLETYENYTLTYLRDDGERQSGVPKVSEYLMNADDHTLLALDGTAVSTPEGWTIERVGARDACIRDDAGAYAVMDARGNITPTDRKEAQERPGEVKDTWLPLNGYQRADFSWCFLNARGQVSPVFEWLGPINPQGQGFVCLEGKIYRIQFPQ